MQLAKRLIPAILFYLACAFVASAQSTTVSGTVTDAGSQAWLNGTYSFTFQPNPQYPTGPYTWTGGTLNTTISGSLNGSGAYSVSIPSNSAITPAGSTWILTVTPNASSNSFSTPRTTITGGTQTLNVTPPAIAINWSLPPGPALSAYADSEITGTLPPGAEYFNTTSLLTRVWNGSAWNNQGSGSGSGVTSVTGTSPIVATPTTGAVGVSCPTCVLQPTGTGVQGEPAIYQGNSLSLGPSDQTVDVSAFGQATWTQDVVAAYGSAACASGCTLVVPDSEAAKGSGAATAIALPGTTGNVNTVNLNFPGVATFIACNITLAPFSHVTGSMGNATIQASGTGCILEKQVVTISEQVGPKLVISDINLDCNSQVSCIPVLLGNVTNADMQRVSFKNATDYTGSSASAPIAGLAMQAAQFDHFLGLKFYNVSYPIKCYSDPTNGGCNSNKFDNINVVSNCIVGSIFANRSSLTNLQIGDNEFGHPEFQNCSVAAHANFGNTNVCSGTACQATLTITGGAPEANGGGASSFTVDGFTVKQASIYLNDTALTYNDPTIAEATITPIIDAEASSIAILKNPAGGAGQTFVTTDATSRSVLIGENLSASTLSQFGNLSTFAPLSSSNSSTPAIWGATLATGSAANIDTFTIQDVCGSGVNPTCQLTFGHSGTSGFAGYNLAGVQTSFVGGSSIGSSQLLLGSGINLTFTGSSSIFGSSTAGVLKLYDVQNSAIANAGTTGTNQFHLVKLTGAPSTAVISATTDTSTIIGICDSSCGTTGNPEIATVGVETCAFDGATTAGDYVQISSTTGGDCHDTGAATPPATHEIIGRVLATIGSAGNTTVLLMMKDQ